MVKVSVIIPVFKVPEKYIRECFNSLAKQTLQECEFILVSDGAPEKECSICEDYAAKDSRFKFFKRSHEGVSSTRNFGIKQAYGEYITFVDSDDWIEPNCCEALFHYATQCDSDVVLFDCTPEGGQFEKTPYAQQSKNELSKEEVSEIKKQCIHLTNVKYISAVSTVCKFVKRTIFIDHSITFADHIKRGEDRPISYKTFEYSKRTAYLKEPFYHYQAVESSITHTTSNTPIPTYLPYLSEIKKTSTEYSELIGNFGLSSFLASLGEDYFRESNKKALLEKIHELASYAKSKDFQWTIQDATLSKRKDIPLIVKLDCILLQRKITLPIWLHAFKWKLFSYIRYKHF